MSQASSATTAPSHGCGREDIMRQLEGETMADLHTHLMGMGSHEFWLEEILLNTEVMPSDAEFSRCDFPSAMPDELQLKCYRAAPLVLLGSDHSEVQTWGLCLEEQRQLRVEEAMLDAVAGAAQHVHGVDATSHTVSGFAHPKLVVAELSKLRRRLACLGHGLCLPELEDACSPRKKDSDDCSPTAGHQQRICAQREQLSQLLEQRLNDLLFPSSASGDYSQRVESDGAQLTFEVVLKMDSLCQALNIPKNVSGIDFIVEDELGIEFDQETNVRRWIVWDAMEQRFALRRGIRLSDLRAHLHTLKQRAPDKHKVVKANLMNAFSMLSKDGNAAGHHEFQGFRSYFTPEFYPRRFILKDDIVEQRLDVLARLISHIMHRNDSCQPRVEYVELSFSLSKLLRPHVLAVLRWPMTGLTPRDFFLPLAKGSGTTYHETQCFRTFPDTKCRYRFLAAINRGKTQIGNCRTQKDMIDFLETYPGQAIRLYIESMSQEWLHPMFDAYASSLDKLRCLVELSPTSIFDMIVGVDLVGDELGYPYNPYATPPFCTVLTQAMKRNPYFGVRIHAGENIPFVRPDAPEFRAFAAHMYILFLGIEQLTEQFASRNIRIGHGVAFDTIFDDEGVLWKHIRKISDSCKRHVRHSTILLSELKSKQHLFFVVTREINLTSNKFLVRFPYGLSGVHGSRQAESSYNPVTSSIVYSTDDDGIWPIEHCDLHSEGAHHNQHHGLAAEICNALNMHDHRWPDGAAKALLRRSLDARFEKRPISEPIVHSAPLSCQRDAVFVGHASSDKHSGLHIVTSLSLTTNRSDVSDSGNGSEASHCADGPDHIDADSVLWDVLRDIRRQYTGSVGAEGFRPGRFHNLPEGLHGVLRGFVESYTLGAYSSDAKFNMFAFEFRHDNAVQVIVFTSGFESLNSGNVDDVFDRTNDADEIFWWAFLPPGQCNTLSLQKAQLFSNVLLTRTRAKDISIQVVGDGFPSHVGERRLGAARTARVELCSSLRALKSKAQRRLELPAPKAYFACLHSRSASTAFRGLCSLVEKSHKDSSFRLLSAGLPLSALCLDHPALAESQPRQISSELDKFDATLREYGENEWLRVNFHGTRATTDLAKLLSSCIGRRLCFSAALSMKTSRLKSASPSAVVTSMIACGRASAHMVTKSFKMPTRFDAFILSGSMLLQLAESTAPPAQNSVVLFPVFQHYNEIAADLARFGKDCNRKTLNDGNECGQVMILVASEYVDAHDCGCGQQLDQLQHKQKPEHDPWLWLAFLKGFIGGFDEAETPSDACAHVVSALCDIDATAWDSHWPLMPSVKPADFIVDDQFVTLLSMLLQDCGPGQIDALRTQATEHRGIFSDLICSSAPALRRIVLRDVTCCVPTDVLSAARALMSTPQAKIGPLCYAIQTFARDKPEAFLSWAWTNLSDVEQGCEALLEMGGFQVVDCIARNIVKLCSSEELSCPRPCLLKACALRYLVWAKLASWDGHGVGEQDDALRSFRQHLKVAEHNDLLFVHEIRYLQASALLAEGDTIIKAAHISGDEAMACSALEKYRQSHHMQVRFLGPNSKVALATAERIASAQLCMTDSLDQGYALLKSTRAAQCSSMGGIKAALAHYMQARTNNALPGNVKVAVCFQIASLLLQRVRSAPFRSARADLLAAERSLGQAIELTNGNCSSWVTVHLLLIRSQCMRHLDQASALHEIKSTLLTIQTDADMMSRRPFDAMVTRLELCRLLLWAGDLDECQKVAAKCLECTFDPSETGDLTLKGCSALALTFMILASYPMRGLPSAFFGTAQQHIDQLLDDGTLAVSRSLLSAMVDSLGGNVSSAVTKAFNALQHVAQAHSPGRLVHTVVTIVATITSVVRPKTGVALLEIVTKLWTSTQPAAWATVMLHVHLADAYARLGCIVAADKQVQEVKQLVDSAGSPSWTRHARIRLCIVHAKLSLQKMHQGRSERKDAAAAYAQCLAALSEQTFGTVSPASYAELVLVAAQYLAAKGDCAGAVDTISRFERQQSKNDKESTPIHLQTCLRAIRAVVMHLDSQVHGADPSDACLNVLNSLDRPSRNNVDSKLHAIISACIQRKLELAARCGYCDERFPSCQAQECDHRLIEWLRSPPTASQAVNEPPANSADAVVRALTPFDVTWTHVLPDLRDVATYKGVHDTYLDVAAEHLLMGQNSDAKRWVDQCNLTDQHPKLCLQKSLICARQGDIASAILWQECTNTELHSIRVEDCDIRPYLLNRFGYLYRRMGWCQRARFYHKKAEEAYNHGSGTAANKVSLAETLSDFAHVDNANGLFGSAVKLHLRALAIYEQAQRRADNNLQFYRLRAAIERSRLCVLYLKLGKQAEAYSYLRQTEQDCRDLYDVQATTRQHILGSDEHRAYLRISMIRDMATTLNNVGIFYRLSGQHEKAVPFHLQALHLCLPVLGQHHSAVAKCHDCLTRAFYEADQYDRSIQHARQALVERKAQGSLLAVALTYVDLGDALQAEQWYKPAALCYNKAISMFEEELYQDLRRIAACHAKLASAFAGLHDRTAALWHLKIAKARWQGLQEPAPLEEAHVHQNIAVAYMRLGDVRQAHRHYRESLGMRVKVIGEDAATPITHQNDHDAIRSYERTLRKYAPSLLPKHIQLAR